MGRGERAGRREFSARRLVGEAGYGRSLMGYRVRGVSRETGDGLGRVRLASCGVGGDGVRPL